MSKEKSLKEENSKRASEDAFSAKAAAGNISEQNEEKVSGKKTIKKKSSKAIVEPAPAEKPDAASSKKTTKKVTAKKATEIKAEDIERKPAKAKKSAPGKAATKDETLIEEKPKVKRESSVKKKTSIAQQPDITGAVVSNPVAEQQQVQGEHTVAILPIAEAETQEEPFDNGGKQAELTTTPNIPEAAEEQEQLSKAAAEPAEVTVGEEGQPDDIAVEQPDFAKASGGESETTFSNDSNSGLKRITFQLRFHTAIGQSIFVTGDHELLGNNNVENAFPLRYLNEEYWSGSLEIPSGQTLSGNISYRYIFKDIDGSTTLEWGQDKEIEPASFSSKAVTFIDSWNSSFFIENTFYTEPFQEVLLKNNFTEVQNQATENATHIFRAKAPLLEKGQTLCILGSVGELGNWDTLNPILLSRKEAEVWYSCDIQLSNFTFPISYKYGIFDVNANNFIRFEEGDNRTLYQASEPAKLTVVSDGFARLPANGFRGAGVAIPVFSLRSERSFGVGEFTDLKLLVDWAKQVGLKLVQILPVNDTTATHKYTDSYPYAAISAFALHPLYLHLPAIVNKENQAVLNSLHEKQAELNNKAHVDYVAVMAAKWDLIKQIFPSQKQQTFNSPDFKAFFSENAHWLVPYAAFSYFREKYKTSDFNQWPDHQTFDAAQIKEIASSPLQDADEVSMYYYVQYHLHLQLRDAASYAHENGIIVKGDIPIGIYRNSCDAWQEPHLFNMDMQAGAPPDDFAVKGQNWGFPTYNWQRMRENGFSWWKKRFKQMSHYFDAFRIDHILGFFRIWSIPMHSIQGIMGHFVPATPVYLREFSDRGISFDVERFTKPYITDVVLAEIFGTDRDDALQFLNGSSQSNYTLKPEFDTQKKVEEYFLSVEDTEQNNRIKSGLFDLISNVILFEAAGSGGQEFHFRIAMDTTSSFGLLDGHTQYHLKELYVDYFYRRQDSFWKKEAMLKLPELKRSTNMLICGEDLGMVPACVPGVMKELAILSLEIQRMPKDPTREFFHPNDAPYLSVVTPSTHDMSTIRGWWEEDRAATQRFFNNELGQWGTAPYFCEPWINKIILMQHLYSPAMWSIFQLQDLLGISASLRRENPHEERINIPADPKHYWRYRMHLTLEALLQETEFTSELKGYIDQSRR